MTEQLTTAQHYTTIPLINNQIIISASQTSQDGQMVNLKYCYKSCDYFFSKLFSSCFWKTWRSEQIIQKWTNSFKCHFFFECSKMGNIIQILVLQIKDLYVRKTVAFHYNLNLHINNWQGLAERWCRKQVIPCEIEGSEVGLFLLPSILLLFSIILPSTKFISCKPTGRYLGDSRPG